MKFITYPVRLLLAAGMLAPFAATAGTETPAPTESTSSSSTATGLLVGKFPGETNYDKIWSAFTLYKDENNPILQEFSLQGRFQAQYAGGDSSTDDYHDAGKGEYIGGSDIEIRRAHIGFKSKWFQNWKFDGQIVVDSDFQDELGDDTFYRDLYDLFITYAPSDAFNLAFGKREVTFGREYDISSKEILTFERSGLSNLLFPGNLTGVWTSGKGIGGHWLYELGAYGNDRRREFSHFDEGAIILAKIGYDYSHQAGLDSAIVSLHYMHNSDPGIQFMTEGYTGSASPVFTDSISLSNDIVQGRFGLTTDILFGLGFEGQAYQKTKTVSINQPDVFGISIIPSYFIADGLQLVGRFQFAGSNGPNGLKPPGRYEEASLLPSKGDVKGNSYISTYLGLNYYIYGHKLKLMTGAEYTQMGGGDYSGTTFYSGLRAYF